MGKVVPESSARTVATEAVFSKTGKIKKRIKNFETVIVDTSDNVLVFPPQFTSNDNHEFDIPEILESVSSVSTESVVANKIPIRHGSILVGLIVAITFSWSVYSLFFTVKEIDQSSDYAEKSIDSTTEANSSAVITGNSFSGLKRNVALMLEKTEWQTDDINSFLNEWNMLSEQDIKRATDTSWYQLLEFSVKKRIAEIEESKSTVPGHSSNEQALITLSLVMGIKDSGLNKNAEPNNSTTDNKNNYKQLLAEITNELANAEKQSKKLAQSHDSETTLYNNLRKKYEAKKLNISNKPIAVKPKKATAISKPAANSQNTFYSSINSNDVDTVVSKYKKAYEHGDIKLMAQLFGATDRQSSKYQSVVTNFDSTFKNSVNRTINFYETTTNFSSDSDKAIVEAKYNASVEFKNGKGVQYTVANVKLHLSKLNSKVLLNRIDVLDRNVNVISRENSGLTSSNGMISELSNKVAFPTAAELQDVTTQLINSYETGNLEHFVSLLSADIKTNDRIDLDGVTKDYSELFKSTSDRQMFIQNLKWTNESIGAKGTGDLEVIILSDEGKTVYSMEGKIQIVAQKLDNKVKITHLYHIEREK